MGKTLSVRVRRRAAAIVAVAVAVAVPVAGQSSAARPKASNSSKALTSSTSPPAPRRSASTVSSTALPSPQTAHCSRTTPKGRSTRRVSAPRNAAWCASSTGPRSCATAPASSASRNSGASRAYPTRKWSRASAAKRWKNSSRPEKFPAPARLAARGPCGVSPPEKSDTSPSARNLSRLGILGPRHTSMILRRISEKRRLTRQIRWFFGR